MDGTHTHPARLSDMKGAAGFVIPDRYALDFVRLLREFDRAHEDCLINVCTDVRLPPDELRRTFARIAPEFPIIGVRGFDDPDAG
jgi:hypothetical protein